MISLIVAMDRRRAIGIENRLPWHVPADLKRFKALTMGHAIVMGRKTFESIGKALPGRANIVVTRRPEYRAAGCTIAHELEEALRVGGPDPFVIGGAELFAQALPLADRLYVTELDLQVPRADAHFPEIRTADWELREEEAGEDRGIRFWFRAYARRPGPRK